MVEGMDGGVSHLLSNMLKNDPKSKSSAPYVAISASAKVGEVTKDEETSFESEEFSSSKQSSENINVANEDSPTRIK